MLYSSRQENVQVGMWEEGKALRWQAAEIIYVFKLGLDLAVLRPADERLYNQCAACLTDGQPKVGDAITVV